MVCPGGCKPLALWYYLGFLLFFVLALGLGVPFLLLGIFSSGASSLPRSGPWLVKIKQALGYVLSDEALSRQLTERMAVTLSGLRKGTIAGADDKLAAAIKGRIARADRELFKKIWGKRSAANRIVEAPGKSGGLYGAGSAVMTPNEQ